MTIEQINWQPIMDRHRKGTTSRGDVWIRFNKESQPVSVYLIMDGETEKHMCEEWLGEEERTDAAAKTLAQMFFDNFIKAEKIIKNNGRKKKNKN